MISIDTSSVPAEMRGHADFAWHVQDLSAFLNNGFDRKERAARSLHEGTHMVYARELGYEPKLRGPSIRYDFTGKFRQIIGRVQTPSFALRMTADPMLVAKFFIGPVYTQERLLAHRTQEQLWEDSETDLKHFKDWIKVRQRRKTDGNLPRLDDIRESVFRDCRSPEFRKKLWDAAHEFEARVFGPELGRSK